MVHKSSTVPFDVLSTSGITVGTGASGLIGIGNLTSNYNFGNVFAEPINLQ